MRCLIRSFADYLAPAGAPRSGRKLARKAGAHKLAGRFSALARRLEIIELRKKMDLDARHLTCRWPAR